MTSGAGAYVALDLETTGLDPARDRITEIGALRFDAEGRELAAWERLVDPGIPIPALIEEITGIADADVRGQPAFAEVADEFAAFAGDAPIVGQNVGFDLGFLKAAGVELPGPALDTLTLAGAVLPGEGSRALGALAGELGIAAPVAHRALADARTTAAVFTALRRRAAELPRDERLGLARLVAIEQPALAREIAGGEVPDGPFAPPALPDRWQPPEPLTRAETPTPVTARDVRAAFSAATRVLPRFEERPQQAEMAEAVARAIAEGGQWLIEAGTGVGKSLAYLIPAAIHAIRNGERAIVSTNTIALQEQLLGEDVPALRDILCAAGVIEAPGDLRVALLKGRANYLCVRRWAGHQTSLGDPGVARLAAALALWLPRTETGDRGELRLDDAARDSWPRFCAADAACLSERPAFVREGRCFLLRARRRAESAHLVVVNHSLLLADVATGQSAIPPFGRLIVDEAHNLEAQATQQFGLRAGPRQIMEAVEAIHRPRGRGRRESGIAAAAGVRETLGAAALDALTAALARVAERTPHPFAALDGLGGDGADDRVSITASVRSRPAWDEVEEGWTELNDAILDAIERSRAAARLLEAAGVATADELDGAAGRLDELRRGLERLVAGQDRDAIVWASLGRDGANALNSAPVEVGPLLAEKLFRGRATVIATSATLGSGDSMAFAAEQMGLPEAATLALGSPFDYERSTLLATPTGLPAPNAPGYDEAVARAIAELACASGGRALALFTSHAALRRAAALARPALEADDIEALVQGERSPRQLIDRLKQHPRAVAFGTVSLWEGVDVRGDALSLLIVARLPFPVPTDPVHRARATLYDDDFSEYSLPIAVLRFRQGFGRLIRDRTDRGVVAVLDARVRTKRYGARFIEALPPCTRLTADIDATADRTREWLAR